MSFERNQKAFEEAVQALSRDMPLLMHGSGDVVPSQVNPDTVRLMSELTVRYIDNLVDAAVDGHQLLTVGVADVKPPPPPVGSKGESAARRRRRPTAPPPPDEKSHSKSKRRRIRLQGDFWDDPLQDPLIQPPTTDTPQTAVVVGDNNNNNDSNTIFSTTEDNLPEESVHIDEWVGVAGVDLYETNRSRSAHVRMPAAMGVQSFIFPICHDSILFGKVTRLLEASRRTLTPILMDSVLLDLVRTEGALKHAKIVKEKSNKESNNNATSANAASAFGSSSTDAPGADGAGEEDDDEPEKDEEAEENEEETALWPGLEGLLPVHRIIAKRG